MVDIVLELTSNESKVTDVSKNWMSYWEMPSQGFNVKEVEVEVENCEDEQEEEKA